MKKRILSLVVLVLVAMSSFAQMRAPSFNWGTIDTKMGSDISVLDIAAIGPDTVIACGDNGSILKSIDAGRNWKSVAVLRGSLHIEFADRNIGYIATSKQIHKTVDGGENWSLAHVFNLNGQDIKGMSLIGTDTLYVIIQCGRDCVSKLMKSTDGAKSWTESFVTKEPQSYYGNWINDAKFIDNVGYLITSELIVEEGWQPKGDYKYSVYKSIDYAHTWDSVAEFMGYYFNDPDGPHKIIDFPPRPVFLLPSTQDFVTIYTEEQNLVTNDGFKTLEQVESLFRGVWKHAMMEIQDNGRASFVFHHDYSFVASLLYFTENYGQSWMQLDKQIDPPVWDPETHTSKHSQAYCATRANDTVFYTGWNYGNIKRSPALPVGIDKVEVFSINVYPNPVDMELKIDGGDLRLKEIEIYDMVGKKVKSISCNDLLQFTLNTSDLKQGIYIFKIFTEKGVIVAKINKK